MPAADDQYEVIAVGSGFGSSFFLHRYLQRRPGARVLVLEAGGRVPGDRQRAAPREHLAWRDDRCATLIDNKSPDKEWKFFDGFGGGSNCWVACTPRLLPDDFRLRTAFGFGQDWPLSYDDLEPFYCDAEDLMHVSGEASDLFPRSRPYPQPPHRVSGVDRLLRDRHPGTFVNYPAARATLDVEGQRAACTANHVCTLCPVNAKFTVENGMSALYENVELKLDSPAIAIEHGNGVATGVRYRDADGREQTARGDLVVLGANGIFNPHLLLRSGIEHKLTGVGVGEQCSRVATIDLEQDGLNGFDAGTLSTMTWYGLCQGDRRRDRAAAMASTVNRPDLRVAARRWAARANVVFTYEDEAVDGNTVTFDPSRPDRPVVTFAGKSERTTRALRDDNVLADVNALVDGLPIGAIKLSPPWRTESHIQCSTRFATSEAEGVADADGLLFSHRNVVLTGSGLFPTSAPGNPTLTLCALALRSAERLAGGGAIA